jgi:hypothetical protein
MCCKDRRLVGGVEHACDCWDCSGCARSNLCTHSRGSFQNLLYKHGVYRHLSRTGRVDPISMKLLNKVVYTTPSYCTTDHGFAKGPLRLDIFAHLVYPSQDLASDVHNLIKEVRLTSYFQNILLSTINQRSGNMLQGGVFPSYGNNRVAD